MVNFEKFTEDICNYEEKRDELIKKSRDVIKLSKRVIYAVLRDELIEAEKLCQDIEQAKLQLDKITKHDNKLPYEGSYKVAIQEYVEAILFYSFVKDGQFKELNVLSHHYLLGLADLSGELVRRAVFLAGKGKIDEVIKIKNELDKLYGELLKFDFRDSEMRRKMDAVKYDLRKLEDLVLDIKIRGKWK